MFKMLNILLSYVELVLIRTGIKNDREQRRRLSICFSCDNRKRISCSVCGCILVAKAAGSYNK